MRWLFMHVNCDESTCPVDMERWDFVKRNMPLEVGQLAFFAIFQRALKTVSSGESIKNYSKASCVLVINMLKKVIFKI